MQRDDADPVRALVATRETLHRVAAHVLARRRRSVEGHIGLRPTPGGFATPPFGAGSEVLRVDGTVLVREVDGSCTFRQLHGSTLRELAAFVDADLDDSFRCGDDTPPLGDVDLPIELRRDHARRLADWHAIGTQALDEIAAALPPASGVELIQLWPEHFDVATSVGLARGGRANLGASPGDGYLDEPYVYVGPWDGDRPGAPDFWNAPFGATCTWADLGDGRDAVDAAVRFLCEGLRNLETEVVT